MKKFADEHQKAYNVPKAPELGYPDTGNGRFSKQLNYFSWFKFNNAQRVQINFLEQITFFLVASVVAASYCPEIAFGLQMAFLFGRVLFSVGYNEWGPDGRLAGAIIMDFCILGAIVFSTWGITNLLKWH